MSMRLEDTEKLINLLTATKLFLDPARTGFQKRKIDKVKMPLESLVPNENRSMESFSTKIVLAAPNGKKY
uniref:Uncharacterized protein n=1 Tax=Romanomermis culicivorax TaxID=13658 RepID=A0A915KTP3_ROMCU